MYILATILPIIISMCASCALLIVLILVILLKKKQPKIKVNEEFIEHLVEALGKRNNIIDVKTINGRVHFEVEDLELVDLEELKKQSTAGVFITNQTIKMLFSYDSEAICTSILALPKEE
ncbi:MAG: hypothetical protein NC310_06165 [Roseburia sp.]|nr:hypothetical protein [Anaeroplasma bactoclasticum]MCM1196635.1 hypothetical protein [Roseburia sp.]MCM1557400.1 hypothetical protein [Anaeroplasma bactoclasticum]